MKTFIGKFKISNRQKMIASIFLTYVLLFSYLFYFTIVNQHRFSEKLMIDAAQSKAMLISASISEYIFNKDKTILQEFVKAALIDEYIEYILFLDLEGDVLAEGGLKRINNAHREKDDQQVYEIGAPEGLLHRSGHIFYVYMPVTHKGNNVGEINLGINTVEINQRLAKATYWVITVFIITLLSGLFITYLLDYNMRSSLRKLTRTTRTITLGDLHHQVNIDIGGEVEELGNSFNQMAKALAEKENQLTLSRNLMVSISNSINAGIAYVSEDYRVIYANSAYQALTQSSLNNGAKCFEYLWHGRGTCKNCPGEFVVKTGKIHKCEREIILEDGEKHIFNIHAYPLQEVMDVPTGFIEYIVDITEQKKLEQELKTYADHLGEIIEERTQELKNAQVKIVHQEKMAALGQLAAGVAHEIGNPLSSLASIVRAIEIDFKDKCSPEKIKLMKGQIDRISKIVKEMVDFSRPASYKSSLIHANQVAHTALGISRYDGRLKKVHVITSLDSNIPALKLDGDLLLQVFLNIIFNAADAMDGNGTLTVTSSLSSNSVNFFFEDTGPGIPEDLLSRVFDPFFTTKDVGKGTGLGLSVTYAIMQDIGGEIIATNGKKGGAVFKVNIPLTILDEGKV